MNATTLPKVVLSRRTAQIAGVTDEEFFTRDSFQLYLNQTLKAVVSASKAGTIRLIVIAEDNGMTGCTDGEKVVLNVCCPFVAAQPGRQEKLYTIIGLLTHECGHILFTDVKIQEEFLTELEKGICRGFPDIEEAIKDPGFRAFMVLKVSYLRNLFEDDYIEIRLHHAFNGLPSVCLDFTREAAFHHTETVAGKTFAERSKCDRVTVLCLMQVCREYDLTGFMKEFGTSFQEIENVYQEVLGLMKKNRDYSCWASSNTRMENLKKAVSVLLPFMLEEYQERVKEEQEKSGSSDPSGHSESTGHEITDRSGTSEENRTPPHGAVPEKTDPDLETVKDIIEKLSEEILSDEKLQGQFEHDLSGCGKSSLDPYESRTIQETLPDAADPKEMAKAELEAERIREEEEDIVSDRQIVIQRAEADRHMIRSYGRVFSEMTPVIKRTVRMLSSVLKDRQLEGRLIGQLYGKRPDMRQIYRDDGRIYSRELIPDGSPNVAFGIRIDESGSMHGAKIGAARKTAVAIEAILRELNVPYCIYGDSADEQQEGDVVIRKYAEFDAYDDQDRYRLMGICDRDNNHDAIALQAVANALHKRPETRKVLLVISDGLPYASGFRGKKAAEQTAKSVAEIERSGIRIFAAALAGCYEEVRGIYGENRVVDIQDLGNLPNALTKVIKKYVAGRA